MNKRTGMTIILITLVLLLLGWSFFQWLNPGQAPREQDGFQQWFWHYRSFDLVAQVALIFAGTLAIAALLPKGDKND